MQECTNLHAVKLARCLRWEASVWSPDFGPHHLHPSTFDSQKQTLQLDDT